MNPLEKMFHKIGCRIRDLPTAPKRSIAIVLFFATTGALGGVITGSIMALFLHFMGKDLKTAMFAVAAFGFAFFAVATFHGVSLARANFRNRSN